MVKRMYHSNHTFKTALEITFFNKIISNKRVNYSIVLKVT